MAGRISQYGGHDPESYKTYGSKKIKKTDGQGHALFLAKREGKENFRKDPRPSALDVENNYNKPKLNRPGADVTDSCNLRRFCLNFSGKSRPRWK
jgi:hypothetical protein